LGREKESWLAEHDCLAILVEPQGENPEKNLQQKRWGRKKRRTNYAEDSWAKKNGFKEAKDGYKEAKSSENMVKNTQKGEGDVGKDSQGGPLGGHGQGGALPHGGE
jgi:hypothetical protein